MHEIVDGTCDPATFSDIELNSLMSADEVVLLSTSEKGLQNCLHKLEKYCDNWCLDINVEKTKVLFFLAKMGSYIRHHSSSRTK